MTLLHLASFLSTPLLAATEYEVGSGRIQGGWSFVWASYGITWATLALYAFSLWLRRPGKHDKDAP